MFSQKLHWGVVSWGGMTRGNASGFLVLDSPAGQSRVFSQRLGAPGDLFEFQVLWCSQGFLCEVSGELIWSSILICVLISFSLIKYMKQACCKSFVCFTPT